MQTALDSVLVCGGGSAVPGLTQKVSWLHSPCLVAERSTHPAPSRPLVPSYVSSEAEGYLVSVSDDCKSQILQMTQKITGWYNEAYIEVAVI